MPSRSRDRHLAKLAARRKAERRAAQRRRNGILGGIGVAAAVVLIVVGIQMLRGNGSDAASTSATPSASASASGAKALPKQVGQVKPQEFPPEQVACGGTKPSAATVAKPQFDSAPSPDLVLKKDMTYTAVMTTSCGTVRIELDARSKPATVASFVFLARQHFFDGQFVPRIDTSIDVIQAGDPTGTLGGGPGYTIPDELTGAETYGPGTLAMANAGPNTGGSQFFLIFGDKGHNLDPAPNYTVFGKVVSGLDVLKRIGQIPVQDPSSPQTQKPTQAVWIESVKIVEEKRAAPSATASPSA